MTDPSTSPLDPLPDLTWQRLSPRYVLVRLISLATGALALAAAAVFGWLVAEWPLALGCAGAVVLFALVRAPFLIRQVRSWGYAERDADLLVRHGLMVRRLSIVPYARMQFVDVAVGPLERLFGLATVQMHTAAVGADATVPGLEPAEAVRLRDRLAALGRHGTEGL
ncbi:hypothetical protein Lfu02_38530 [Longispora fulva]|uniref:Membrane protein YdbS with pleckstrin-like domain n=1 Tax=Longispora fulva TaxID=619741 RepID=A0A8J7GKQ0_9ACTN|nr:PH domain-containing protein [Longispora fulva]MBG6141369.1 membrane protein YdbS with pleckstrin-like domain [Longispora fulva]GIG59481.1 hypothetical protein Lfu02_38530 [Longispora fulva]